MSGTDDRDDASDANESTTPLLVIKGDATDEEVAAIVAVLQGMAAANAAAAAAARPAPVSSWASAQRGVRVAHHHGRGGWRASGLPR
jgi:hypothetical protein